MISLFIEHEGSNGTTGVGTITGLTTDTDGSSADTELVLGAGDSTGRRRHQSEAVLWVDITEEVDGEQPANGVPYIPSRLGQ